MYTYVNPALEWDSQLSVSHNSPQSIVPGILCPNPTQLWENFHSLLSFNKGNETDKNNISDNEN